MSRFGHNNLVALIVTGVLLVGLCLWPGYATADGQQKSDPVDPLPRVRSAQHLKELLDTRSNTIRYSRTAIQGMAIGAADVAVAAPEMAKADDFSSTNVQVEGVDEADLVKTSAVT
jgi:inhibitor of cysteine peptidase